MWCLVKDSGRAPHKFGTYIYSTSCLWICWVLLSIFPSPEAYDGTVFLCLCIESRSHRFHSHQTHPSTGIQSSTPHICFCVFAITLSCSRSAHFFPFFSTLGKEHRTREGEKVVQFPPLGSHTPTETPLLNTHSQHMHSVSLHCLICIWDRVVN